MLRTLALLLPALPAAAGPMSLAALAAAHGTDKLRHGYIPVYDSHIGPGKSGIRAVLEFGVLYGSSIKMWRDWLPQSTIVGIDNFSGIMGAWRNHGHGRHIANHTKFLVEARAGLHGDHVVLLDRNVSNEAGLRTAVADLRAHAPFDLIIDDASHSSHDQMACLAAALPLLRPGGLFIIEDIHTSLERGYDLPPTSSQTALRVVERFNRTGVFQSKFVSQQDARYIVSRVASAEVFVTGSKSSRTALLKTRKAAAGVSFLES
jgi:hypothetical protein